MLSIAAVNAALNAALWVLHAFVAYLIESIYVAAARLEIVHSGTTRATDSTETDLVRWFIRLLFPTARKGKKGRLRGWFNSGPCSTTPWAIGLMISGFLFLPAELLAETGIDTREPCGTIVENSIDGICASTGFSGSVVGIAAYALLVQRVQWIDQQWDTLFEGASRNMHREHVYRADPLDQSLDIHTTKVASNCRSVVEPCIGGGCGSFTLEHANGAFSRIVTNASMFEHAREAMVQSSNGTRALNSVGLTAFDGSSLLAFMFQELDVVKVVSVSAGNSTYKVMEIGIEGVETLLSSTEVDAVNGIDSNPLTLALSPDRTRKYRISCQVVGMTPALFTTAVAIFRAVQFERPIVAQSTPPKTIHDVLQMNSSDVLKAIYALKAEDKDSSCSRSIPVYVSCGTYNWRPAAFIVVITILFFITFFVVHWYARGVDIQVPHDTRTWRSYALSEILEREVRAEAKTVGDRTRIVLVSERVEKPFDEESSPAPPRQ